MCRIYFRMNKKIKSINLADFQVYSIYAYALLYTENKFNKNKFSNVRTDITEPTLNSIQLFKTTFNFLALLLTMFYIFVYCYIYEYNEISMHILNARINFKYLSVSWLFVFFIFFCPCAFIVPTTAFAIHHDLVWSLHWWALFHFLLCKN